jgi:hypothetical protein
MDPTTLYMFITLHGKTEIERDRDYNREICE